MSLFNKQEVLNVIREMTLLEKQSEFENTSNGFFNKIEDVPNQAIDISALLQELDSNVTTHHHYFGILDDLMLDGLITDLSPKGSWGRTGSTISIGKWVRLI